MREWENLSAAAMEVGACEATTLLDAVLTGDRGWGGGGADSAAVCPKEKCWTSRVVSGEI